MEKHYVSKEIWEQIYLQSPIGIAIIGLDYKFLKVNTKIRTFLGYTEQELLEMTIHDITHPKDSNAEKTEIENIKRGLLPGYEILKRILTKHGRIEWVKQTMWPVRNQNGEIINFVTHIQPLLNGDREKLQKGETKEVNIRPTLTIREFVLDNWKSFVTATVFFISTCIMCGVAFNTAIEEIERQKTITVRQQQLIEKLQDRLYYDPSDILQEVK